MPLTNPLPRTALLLAHLPLWTACGASAENVDKSQGPGLNDSSEQAEPAASGNDSEPGAAASSEPASGSLGEMNGEPEAISKPGEANAPQDGEPMVAVTNGVVPTSGSSGGMPGPANPGPTDPAGVPGQPPASSSGLDVPTGQPAPAPLPPATATAPSMGSPEQGSAGASGMEPEEPEPPTGLEECIRCDEGFVCFEEVDTQRCFEVCATEVPNVTLETQADVEALAALRCEVVGGDFRVEGAGVTDLSALSNIRAIRGSLTIIDTEQLVDLNGLDGLRYLGNELVLQNNVALTGIGALSQAAVTDGASITLHDNHVLESLDGVQGFVNPGGVLFTNNFALADISAFSPVTMGNLLFSGNGAFPVMSFPNLHTVDGDFALLSETSCEQLLMPMLDYVGRVLLIPGNAALAEVDLSSLVRIGADVTITSNEVLTTLLLPKLESVGSLVIAGNLSFPQCEAEQIASQVGSCTCQDNDLEAVCE